MSILYKFPLLILMTLPYINIFKQYEYSINIMYIGLQEWLLISRNLKSGVRGSKLLDSPR